MLDALVQSIQLPKCWNTLLGRTVLSNQKPVPEVNYRLDVVPAGDIHLTVPDLARILSPHVNDGLIWKNTTMLRRVFESKKCVHATVWRFGVGLISESVKSMARRSLCTAAEFLVTAASFCLATKSGDGVCIAANAGDQHLVVNTVACLAMDLLTGQGRRRTN